MHDEAKPYVESRLPEYNFRKQDPDCFEMSRHDALFLLEHPLKFIETFSVFDHHAGHYIPLLGMLPEHREDLLRVLVLKDSEAEQRLSTPHPNARPQPPGYWDAYQEYE